MTLFASVSIVTLAACDGSNGDLDTSTTVIASLAVTSSAPAAASATAGTNTKVVAVFNRAMKSDTLTQNSFTLQGDGESGVVGAVAYNADTKAATFTPNGNLTASTLYTATITTAVEDETDASLLSDFVWSFTTGSSIDDSVPTPVTISPADIAIDVLRNTKVSVIFSEAIDPETLTPNSFELTTNAGIVVVSGELLYVNPKTVVFTPDANLGASELHTLTLSTAILDLAGNSLALSETSFTTGTEVSSSPAIVDLGTAGNYVILAKTGISTTGTTHITGDIAVSPASRTTLTGFADTLDSSGMFSTSPRVTGELFASNMEVPTPDDLTTAVSDMETAYTDAAGRVTPDFTELGAGEIGGLTLDPGLYKWGTGVLVTSDVTLNGSANDVWIFQIDQNLKLEDGKAVVLTGGALPENIFWQVAGEVTLQAGTTFNGIILTQTQVVFKSGAVLNGRALAQTAVTLISNDINEPAQ
ncbi:ice-binding family protein [Saccharospirillum impatiens]|uniref:ice-binding family protein n=1 Tax=Saccharospirillum impatiens TaxID=169438 RepID=UPI00146F2C5B|nr:ice-binding family protein [Saccharospirillum impatiens]